MSTPPAPPPGSDPYGWPAAPHTPPGGAPGPQDHPPAGYPSPQQPTTAYPSGGYPDPSGAPTYPDPTYGAPSGGYPDPSAGAYGAPPAPGGYSAYPDPSAGYGPPSAPGGYPAATGYPAAAYAGGPGQYADPSAPFGYDPQGRPYSDKQKLIAGLLQILIGGFGVGRFYTGHTGIAVAQIAVTIVTCGIGAIWGLIDGIMILVNGGTDAQGRPLRSD
ncbi:MAG TPA: NINE protein [Pseudonocardiaceae bacterium]